MKRSADQAPALEGVASAERTLTLLSAFRKGDGAVSLAELSARTGLVKSTIMRLAVSLEAHGYLGRLPDGSYRLEAELLRLGAIYQQSFRLEAHVAPVLERLVAATGESAAFYIRRGEQRLCLFRADSPQRLRLHVRAGDLLPMDSSAIARVLRLFTSIELVGEAEATRFPLFTSGAHDPHAAGMAAPVFGSDDVFVGALTLSGPVTRFTREAALVAGPVLLEAARGLSRGLGSRLAF